MANKTTKITYNLYDTGRKYTGQDRSNLDVPTLVDMINSPQVQEMVKHGQMHGYYGHQIRQRYGMIPPETAIINGETIRLAPAFRTIHIKAQSNGDVTHIAEFYNNDAGQFAKRQYEAKIGGFSTAISTMQRNGRLVPTGFYGFDYVTQQNYVHNVGDGALFDSANAMQCELLDKMIVMQFDSIHQQLQIVQQYEHALDTIAEYERKERRQAIREERERERYTGLVGRTLTFDSVLAEANERLHQEQHSEEKPLIKFGFGW